MAELGADLQNLQKQALDRCSDAESMDGLAQIRSEYLGKKGQIGLALRGLGKLEASERRDAGQQINTVKQAIESALDAALKRLQAAQIQLELLAGAVDVSLPGRRAGTGVAHPLRQVQADIVRSLATLGFSVAEGPLVEHDWFNFEALNIPADHPARDMQDTFFVAPEIVLRTHTSNVQIRTMVDTPPPIRILSPGMVFRHDDVDPTHSPVFHQIEGLWVDEKATFADLKGVLRKLAGDLFGKDAKLRFRPSYFPFTEPSAEIDVTCSTCMGAQPACRSCRVCKGTGWLEILGAGMVDPAVLRAVGYDPDKVQGFAFGAGIERIAMLRWGIDDIRLFYENDLRFLQLFGGRWRR